MKTFASFMLMGIAYSSYNDKCTGAIDRILNDVSISGVKQFEKQTSAFVDSGFPATQSEMIQWPAFRTYNLPTPTEFISLGQKYPNNKLFGSDNTPDPHGVKQGAIGNCYIKAAFSCMAEHADQFKSYWNTKADNKAGIYSANWFIAGKQRPVTVDDKVPGRRGRLMFAQLGLDGGKWAPILEKMWSKINGAYDQTVGGNTGEGFMGLNGNPSMTTGMDTFKDGETLFNWLEGHDKQNALISASSLPGSSHFKKTPDGVARSHAYTVLKTETIMYNGKEQKLIKMRNPWSSNNYNGTWSDKDPRWKESGVASQVGGIGMIERRDGVFYIPPEKMMANFRAIQVGHNIAGHSHSQVESQRDDNTMKTYTFTIAKDQTKPTFMAAISYASRMYPARCAGRQLALARVYAPNGQTIKYTWVDLGGAHYSTMKFDNLKKGNYKVTIVAKFTAKAKNDYIFDVYTGERVTIKKNQKDVENIHRGGEVTPSPPATLESEMNAWSSTAGTSRTFKVPNSNNAVSTYYEKKDNMMYAKMNNNQNNSKLDLYTFFKLPAGATVQGKATNNAAQECSTRYAGWVVCSHPATGEARSIVKASKPFAGRVPFFGYRVNQ